MTVEDVSIHVGAELRDMREQIAFPLHLFGLDDDNVDPPGLYHLIMKAYWAAYVTDLNKYGYVSLQAQIQDLDSDRIDSVAQWKKAADDVRRISFTLGLLGRLITVYDAETTGAEIDSALDEDSAVLQGWCAELVSSGPQGTQRSWVEFTYVREPQDRDEIDSPSPDLGDTPGGLHEHSVVKAPGRIDPILGRKREVESASFGLGTSETLGEARQQLREDSEEAWSRVKAARRYGATAQFRKSIIEAVLWEHRVLGFVAQWESSGTAEQRAEATFHAMGRYKTGLVRAFYPQKDATPSEAWSSCAQLFGEMSELIDGPSDADAVRKTLKRWCERGLIKLDGKTMTWPGRRVERWLELADQWRADVDDVPV